MAAHLGLTFENEFKAIARAMGALYPEARYVFEMGGETSKFIELEADAETGRTGIIDYQTNGDCAAGTGSFMDQQANRLLYEIEDVGDIVLGAGKAATVAGRCSVFAKSDRSCPQKGYLPPRSSRPRHRRGAQLTWRHRPGNPLTGPWPSGGVAPSRVPP